MKTSSKRLVKAGAFSTLRITTQLGGLCCFSLHNSNIGGLLSLVRSFNRIDVHQASSSWINTLNMNANLV